MLNILRTTGYIFIKFYIFLFEIQIQDIFFVCRQDMGGQSKLQLGAFTIFPAFGIILPNGHQTITVDCVAEQQGRFDEVSQLSYGP